MPVACVALPSYFPVGRRCNGGNAKDCRNNPSPVGGLLIGHNKRTSRAGGLNIPILGINMPNMGRRAKARVPRSPKRTSLADALFSA